MVILSGSADRAHMAINLEPDGRPCAAGEGVRSFAAPPALRVDAFGPVREGANRPTTVTRDLGRLPSPVHGKVRGARPARRAATDPEALGGQHQRPRQGGFGMPALPKPARGGRDPGVAARLWTRSQKLTGSSFTDPSGRRQV